MAIPGVNAVGAVYVEVMTDTSGMKDAIERQSQRAAKWGGQKAADSWEKSFEKRMKKSNANVAKWNMTRAIDQQWDKIAARQADKLQAAFRKGKPITIDVDDSDLQELEATIERIRKAAIKSGVSPNTITIRKALEGFADRQQAAVERTLRGIQQVEKERVKTSEQLTKQLKREQKQFENWLKGANYNEAVDKFAREIERTVPRSVRKSLKKGVGDADLGPELNLLAQRISQKFGKSLKDVRLGAGSRISDVVDEKDVAKLDKFERRIMVFNRRVTSGGSIVTKILGGFLSIPLAGAGLVLKLFTGIPVALTKAAGGVAKFGAAVGKVFPKAGAVIGRFASALGAVAARLAAFILPVAIIAAWKAFSSILGALVSLANAAAAALVMLGTTIVGLAASLVPLAINAGALGVGLGVIVVAAKPAFQALQALNQAVSTGSKDDWAKYNEAMKQLGPNAQAAVRSLRPLVEGLKGFRRELSERFFDGMADSLKNLGPTFDIVKSRLLEMSTVAGQVVTGFIGALSAPEFQYAISTLLFNFEQMFASLGAAGSNFFVGLVNALSAISPIAVRIADAIKGISERFLAWTNSADNMQKLYFWFDQVYNIGSAVWGIVTSLIGVVASLFNQSAPGTTGALETIQGLLDKWKIWVDNNKGAINQWIEDGKDIIGDFATGVGDVLDAFQKLNTPEAKAGLSALIDLASNLLGIVAAIAGFWDRISSRSAAYKPPSATATVGAQAGTGSQYYGANAVRTGGGSSNWVGRPTANRAAGGLVTKPEFGWTGEAGPELVVPLRRHLGQVDPAVRSLSAMLQGKPYKGQQPAMGGPSKVVNVTQHITPNSADPQAVAHQMLNRLVVVARG
jgi:hypothetical protein